MQSFVSILMLAVLLVQGLFGSMTGSVVICLGGGHHHDEQTCDFVGPEAPAPEATCCSGCSHEDSWPAPPVDDHHHDDCGCTDIELALIDLLFTPRTAANVDQLVPANQHDATLVAVAQRADIATPRLPEARPPPVVAAGVACAHRLAIVRTSCIQV